VLLSKIATYGLAELPGAPPTRPDQICSFPSRRWRVRKRPDFDKLSRSKAKQEAPGKAKVSTSTVETFELGIDETSMTSISSEKVPKQEIDAPETISLLKNDSSKVAYECDEPEEEILSDYNVSDDEFTPSKRKRRKEASVRKGKKNALAWKLADRVRNLTREEINQMPLEERKKPYMCEICFKRYKNTQGIRYHYQHYDHDSVEETLPQMEVPEVAPPEKKDVPSDAAKGENVETSAYCDFCLGDARENKKTGTKEELISCSDCGRSGHPSCLQFTDNLIIEVKKYKWQCIECKSCSLCGTSDNDDQLLFCDECDRGYHMYCLTPKMSEPPEGHWCCKLCEDRIKATGDCPPPPPPPITVGSQ